MKNVLLVTSILFISFSASPQSVNDYLKVLETQSEEPTGFIEKKLKNCDLIIFDDALHAAVEPFEFYCDYLKKYPSSVDYVFLEVFAIDTQDHIEAFLGSSVKDISLLAKVFQKDFSYGWPYETYLDLLSTIWDINQTLDEGKRIKVIGVDQPIYWEGLHTRKDYEIFQQSLIARDNFMYRTVLKKMNDFKDKAKGFFLTNTRHAYKGIKNKDGMMYWNAGTFFHQLHPGKTYSIRFHNMILKVESIKENVKNASTAGLDRLEYKWVRMDNGKWDEAFSKNGNKAVAIPLKDNVFGQHPYLGNHTANVFPGQTMYDAYDALIFMVPLEETKFSATTNFYFTDEFKKELEHRIKVIRGENLSSYLKKNSFENIKDYIEELGKARPKTKNPLVE